MKKRIKKISCSYLLLPVLLGFNLNATTLRDSVEQTINLNPDIISEHYNKKENRMNIENEEGDYFPILDFTTYLENSKIDSNYKNNTSDTNEKIDGWNANITLKQILYDGGKTPREVEQSQHQYYNIKYTSNEAVESIILNVTHTYLDLLLNQTLEEFAKFKLKTHNYYLKLAQEKEDISGEILDRLQVQSKINALIDSNLEQEVKKQKSFSAYENFTQQKISGNICKPIIDEKLIPHTLEEAIEIAINNDNKIRAQHALVQKQKSAISIQKAQFIPVLSLELEADWDHDLSLEEKGQENSYTARIKSTWNFYNGGKDSILLEKEKIAMLKERKILDAITNSVKDEIKGAYNTYFQLKKRLENLKKSVEINNQIVDVYREQLKEGSRTFLDLLNAETEVFRTKILLEEQEINSYKEYFNILKSLNKLSDSVLSQKNIVCQKFDINTLLPHYQSQEEKVKELGLED